MIIETPIVIAMTMVMVVIGEGDIGGSKNDDDGDSGSDDNQ